MAINRITITQADKYKTIVHPYFTETDQPLGSVLVLHGMAEHHERYIPFAQFLNANGYDVFLYDHRGHGCDKKFEDLGFFADHDGYKLVIADAVNILKYVASVNRGKKLILFSHSMGSLIGRNVIQQFDSLTGAIFCGTAHQPRLKTMGGLMLSSLVKRFKGPHTPSPFLNNACVGYSDFAKISNRTAFDWLTRDNNIVGTYINDAYCGFICTTSFYHDLIKLTYCADTPKLIKKTRRDLNILFMSGSHDPVGSYGQGVYSLFGLYQKLGFVNCDCTIYEECRHELLNELNRATIMDDVLAWITKLDS